MSGPTIDSLITEMRRLHAAATPGEWKADTGDIFASEDDPSNLIADCPQWAEGSYRRWSANSQFIVFTRNNVPALLDRLEAAEQRLDRQYADSMIAHRWFSRVFGESFNGRDFAVKCPAADRELEARDTRMKCEGAAEWLEEQLRTQQHTIYDAMSGYTGLIYNSIAQEHMRAEAARLREEEGCT